MLKMSKQNVNSTPVAIKADRQIFSHLLVIQEKRETSLKKVMTYELGPVPWSLAMPNGSLVKSAKASLMKVLEEQTPKVPVIPQGTAIIYDALVLIHKLPTALTTFGDISPFISKLLLIKKRVVCFFCDRQLPGKFH